jgi:hypothetical protein
MNFTMTLTPTIGNTLFATVGTYDSIGYCPVSSITQIGVTWTLQKYKRTNQFNFENQEIWKGVVEAGASTSGIVTLSAPVNAGAVIDVYENTSSSALILDKTADAEGVGSFPSTGITEPTTANDELCIGGILGTAYASDQTNPTNGFTLFDGVSDPGSNISEAYLEKIVGVAGTVSSGTTMGYFYWCGCIATFFESGVSPPKPKGTIPIHAKLAGVI